MVFRLIDLSAEFIREPRPYRSLYTPWDTHPLGILNCSCYYQMLQRKLSCISLQRRAHMFLPCLSDTCAHILGSGGSEELLSSSHHKICIAGVSSGLEAALRGFSRRVDVRLTPEIFHLFNGCNTRLTSLFNATLKNTGPSRHHSQPVACQWYLQAQRLQQEPWKSFQQSLRSNRKSAKDYIGAKRRDI
jgi:hypothetical protein